MSFKRDSDSKEWLNNLQKRRIADLLSENIPANEAKLLCNGRFACIVCPNCPVFDTINMLAVHRSGKKHSAYDPAVDNESVNNDMGPFTDAEHYVNQMESSLEPALRTSSAYNPCIKKCKQKPYERKKTINVSKCSNNVKDTKKIKSILKNGDGLQADVSSNPRDNKLNSISSTTYSDKTQSKEMNISSKIVQSVPQTIAQYRRNKRMNNMVNDKASKTLLNAHATNGVDRGEMVAQDTQAPIKNIHVSSNASDMKYKKPSKQFPEEQKMLAQKYLAAIGSGWKKNWNGEWIKDDNAEFDSDEEPPAVP